MLPAVLGGGQHRTARGDTGGAVSTITLPDLRVGPWAFPIPAPRRRVLGSGARRLLRMVVLMVLLVLAVALAGVTVPRVLGYTTLLVRSGSMGHAYPVGSIAIAKSVDRSDVEVGDVILIRKENSPKRAPYLHRVVDVHHALGRLAVKTKGDTNSAADPDDYALPKRVPVAVFDVPYLGYLLGYVATPLGWALLMVLPATVLCASLLVRVWSREDESGAIHWSGRAYTLAR